MKVSKSKYRVEYIKSIIDSGKTQKQIADFTGISKSTVHDITRELHQAGIVNINWDRGKTVILKKGLSIQEISKLVRVFTDFRDNKTFTHLMNTKVGEGINDTMLKEIRKVVDEDLVLNTIKGEIDKNSIKGEIAGELPPLYAFDMLDMKATITCKGRVSPEALEPEIEGLVKGLSDRVRVAQNAGEELLNYFTDREVELAEKEIESLRGSLLRRVIEVFKVSPGALKSVVDLIMGMNEPKDTHKHLKNYLLIVEAIISNSELKTVKLTQNSIDVEKTLEERKPPKDMTLREIAEDSKGRVDLNSFLFPFSLNDSIFNTFFLNNFKFYMKSDNEEKMIE